MKRLHLLCALLTLVVAGCADPHPFQPSQIDAGTFSLSARYTQIRSFPEGGGVFTVFIEPGMHFKGDVRLSLRTDAALHATLNLLRLDNVNRVAEVCIAPEAGVAIKPYVIELRAWHNDSLHILPLHVEMYEWSNGDPAEVAPLLNSYLQWLQLQHPELGNVAIAPFRSYLTYPQHLVVEHWTYLSAVWELRLCRHVMIPPHDWSMILLRRLGTREPVVAARLERSGENFREIPVSEYPILYGY